MAIPRRNFLKTGGAAAVGLALGGIPRLARAGTTGKNLIVMFVYGGWDPTYALDPKPGLTTVDAPAGQVKMFGDVPILVEASRPSVDAFFTAWSQKAAVVNGMHVHSIVHTDCAKRVLTGTPGDFSPDLGAIVGHELGRDLPVPYLILGQNAFTGPLAASAAKVGPTKQLVALLDPTQAYPPAPGTMYPPFVPDAQDDLAMRAYVLARADRDRATRGAGAYNAARIDDFVDSLDRGDSLRNASAGFGQRGLTLGTSEQIAIALDSLESGLCRSVLLQDANGWDSHSYNAQQSMLHDGLFGGLLTLMDELSVRPGREAGSKLLDETVVVVLSEMGRTPMLNESAGKDHWPVTSALVMGAGVAGGTVVGATDDGFDSKPVNLVTGLPDAGGARIQTPNLVGAVLEIAGLEPTAWLPGEEVLRAIVA